MVSKPELAAILEHYGLNIIYKHGWQACKCIIHDDKHASAAYNLDEQRYNCLVCQILGDVYDVVAKKEGISFTDAKRKAEKLADGNSHSLLQVTHSTGSLLPSGTRNNSGSRKYIPSWKRRGA